jgi:hypothetical protein
LDKGLKKIKTHILYPITFLKVVQFMRYVKKYGAAGGATDESMSITRGMCRVASWITKVTNTYSEYVILVALPLQQWLHEFVSMLRYTFVSCVILNLFSYFSCTDSDWNNKRKACRAFVILNSK